AAGSRDESAQTAGSTHFLEHMLFKGTATKDAKTIAAAFDRTGGDANAITAKELTCYYSRCLVTDLPSITGLLLDMVSNAELDVDEFERERGVIIEELAMSADDPSDVLFDDFDALVFGEHPLARPVGATKDQIRALGHHTVTDHYCSTYIPPRLVIAAAGGATHEEVLRMVEDALAEAGLGSRAWSADGVEAGAHLGGASRRAPVFQAGSSHTVKRSEEHTSELQSCFAHLSPTGRSSELSTSIPPRLVIAAAGGATHEEVLRMVEDALAEAGLGSRAWSADGVEAGAHLGGASRRAPVFQAGSSHTVKDTEQLGILLGCEDLPEGHDDRFVYSVLLTMLGGGMSSRLFQSVREERGLAYAVNCVASQFTDSGTFGIYAGCTAEHAQAVVDLALAEWDRLVQD